VHHYSIPVQPTPIHFDSRWFGHHGIGRFAHELFRRVPGATALPILGAKLSPIDPLASTWAAARLRSGTYFSPGFNPPLRSPIPFVFTIHDLTHLNVASESSWLRGIYYRTVVRPGARRAGCVLTVSEHSRRDIIDWTGLAPERVTVVGNGVSERFTPDGPTHAEAEPYFLHVGRRGGNKNIEGLLKAFSMSRARSQLLLVFTGAADARTVEAARRLEVQDRVRFTGAVDDCGLAALYRGAVALVYPSTHEGFGLPVVEAMACRTAVVTSALTATAEVAGAANAVLVDPSSVDELSAAMDRLAQDPTWRDQIAGRGPARARQYSWDLVAQRVSAALADV
jgi:glycosyltransferase involved in cell wall biosynthesis